MPIAASAKRTNTPATTSRITITGPISSSFDFRLEEFLQEAGDFSRAGLHDFRKFALVEPDAVAVGAAVELDAAERHPPQARAAPDARPLAVRRLARGLHGVAQLLHAPARALEDLVDLARVEPGPAARDAVVGFDPLEHERHERLAAGRAHVWIIMTASGANRYMDYHVDIDTVRRAQAAARSKLKRTRLVRSGWLSALGGGEVLLKCENEQETGSFKVRGAVAKVAAARPERVASASAGNHGLGLAWAARGAGVACTIFVPRTVPAVKAERIAAPGATLVKAPFDTFDPTQEYALSRLDGATWVSAYDDPDVIAGNGGTTALEIFEEARVDAVVVPCGGGGLAIGAGIVAHRHGAKLIGVNSEASPGMWLSRRDGRAHLTLDSKPTIAEGIEGGVAESTYRLGLEHIDDVVTVPEESIRRAVAETKRREGMAIEGSAAAAVAAIVEGRVPRNFRRIVVVLTGGNIDPARLETLLLESRP